MRTAALLAALAGALWLAAPANSGSSPVSSDLWAVSHVDGHVKVTWSVSGAYPGWYVDEIEVASRPEAASNGHFFFENLVDYEPFFTPTSGGTWLSEYQLPFGRYFVRLFGTKVGCLDCWFYTSVKVLNVGPSFAGLSWSVTASGDRLTVGWTPPGQGWYVSAIWVDTDNVIDSGSQFTDWASWSSDVGQQQWLSRPLNPNATYYVRVQVSYSGCDAPTCRWLSDVRGATTSAATSPPPSTTAPDSSPVVLRPKWTERQAARRVMNGGITWNTGGRSTVRDASCDGRGGIERRGRTYHYSKFRCVATLFKNGLGERRRFWLVTQPGGDYRVQLIPR